MKQTVTKNKFTKFENKRKPSDGIFRFEFFLLILISAMIGGNLLAQDFQRAHDGVEYAQFTRKIKNENVVFSALRLDLTKVRLDVVHAMDSAIGTETTSSMAMRYGALAAINAGFFRLDKSIFLGDSTGILMIDGKILSESHADRIALTISNSPNKSEVFINHLGLSSSIAIGGQSFRITGINRQRGEDDLIIYTPEFNFTTLTDKKGVEVIVRGNKILRYFDERGNTEIPSNGFVISASGKFRERLSAAVRRNLGVTLNWNWKTFGAEKYPRILKNEDIIGGQVQLVRNSRVELTWEREKSSRAFVETRHPRTAVAKLKDGKFLMLVADGRSEQSAGIALGDLAEVFLEMGATAAMNLDGGGSTTMFLDGKIVNSPSDKEGERRVSDAILVFPRGKN